MKSSGKDNLYSMPERHAVYRNNERENEVVPHFSLYPASDHISEISLNRDPENNPMVTPRSLPNLPTTPHVTGYRHSVAQGATNLSSSSRVVTPRCTILPSAAQWPALEQRKEIKPSVTLQNRTTEHLQPIVEKPCRMTLRARTGYAGCPIYDVPVQNDEMEPCDPFLSQPDGGTSSNKCTLPCFGEESVEKKRCNMRRPYRIVWRVPFVSDPILLYRLQMEWIQRPTTETHLLYKDSQFLADCQKALGSPRYTLPKHVNIKKKSKEDNLDKSFNYMDTQRGIYSRPPTDYRRPMASSLKKTEDITSSSSQHRSPQNFKNNTSLTPSVGFPWGKLSSCPYDIDRTGFVKVVDQADPHINDKDKIPPIQGILGTMANPNVCYPYGVPANGYSMNKI